MSFSEWLALVSKAYTCVTGQPMPVEVADAYNLPLHYSEARDPGLMAQTAALTWR